MGSREIVLRGAAEHNLKNVDLVIPRDTLTTFTGVSGSGKSSLAFDTIFREGQRRYMESLSAYARQFLGKMEKPRLEHIEGLSPTISIDQKTIHRNPRSTVGTITEIYDHLRLLYARLGVPHCPDCSIPISGRTSDQIVESILEVAAGQQTLILAPIVQDRKGEYRKELEDLRLRGYVRARVDGELRRLEQVDGLDRYKNHTIEVVIDRIVPDAEKRSRLAEAVEQALRETKGLLAVLAEGEVEPRLFSESFACPRCGFSMPELEPRVFSFNSPHGACPECSGIGHRVTLDSSLLVRHPEVSLKEGAIPLVEHWRRVSALREAMKGIELSARDAGFSIDAPWEKLSEEQCDLVLHGSRSRGNSRQGGLLSAMESTFGSLALSRYRREVVCDSCHGTRLRRSSLAVRFHDRNIHDISSLSIERCASFFETLTPTEREGKIGEQLFRELRSRLGFLRDVGLSYLTLDRRSASLAGGEAQRIRLATQLGSRLQGVLYVLDEPSIGLHARDNARLLETLKRLRDQGNTVFVVEHDLETMLVSDHIIDIGPGAGVEGGRVVAQGQLADIAASQESITGQYLRGELKIPLPATRRSPGDRCLRIVGATEHNLHNVTVEIPLGLLVAVTGVSGSGKSTLVDDILRKALAFHLNRARTIPGRHEKIEGLGLVDKVIEIDQSPIGRTPRSNPATYTKVFDEIRKLFTRVPDARARGYSPGRFSFNVEGGRCEGCQGAGVNVVEMQFLPDVEVLCEDCSGKRFNRETLQIRYREKSIFDVLDMSVAEAREFFEVHKKIATTLETLEEVGLGYVRLGQPATTLSGGEAQRVKLAAELRKSDTGCTLYILDEPTTGLHIHDVAKLVLALQKLVDKGNTVVVIEHNLDVVKVADHLIDLGPDGGDGGGQVVATGTPEEVAGVAASHTGRALKTLLESDGLSGVAEAMAPRPRPVRHHGGRDLCIRGARKNNLRSVDVQIPAGKLTVVTGVSGSGKTSLVFDTIFAEGQRRFVECLSTYARRFLGRLDQPPVDSLEGLAPAVAIDQKQGSHNPRSTVATSTEIFDGLRLLYARVGIPHCPVCQERLGAFSPGHAADDVLRRLDGKAALVLAPLYDPDSPRDFLATTPGKITKEAARLRSEGFSRLLVGSEIVRLEDYRAPRGKGSRKRAIHLVIDRVNVSEKAWQRLVDSLEIAQKRGSGLAVVTEVEEGHSPAPRLYSKELACPSCDFRPEVELSPRLFSFNGHQGACETCAGLGFQPSLDEFSLFERPELPVFGPPGGEAAQAILGGHTLQGTLLKAAARHVGVDLALPYANLPRKATNLILDGLPGVELDVEWLSSSGRKQKRARWEGFRQLLLRWNREYPDASFMAKVRAVLKDDTCPACNGDRLKPFAISVTLGGKSIADLCRLSVTGAFAFLGALALDERASLVAEQPLQQIQARLGFLAKVGLEYLTLDRRTSTLSGGEAQRIRLATQIGSRLVGVIYVLDEPTIGLHPRDTERLLESLTELRDAGNTVIVVEHDEQSIRAADHIIDMGPGAGKRGGEIVAEGPLSSILESPRSLTGRHLRGELRIPVPATRRRPVEGWIEIKGARENNLKSIDARFPVGALTAVTGVSGSGKSTLVMEILRKALARKLRQGRPRPGDHDEVHGHELVSKLVVIDQSPIGRTPASNAATYTGAFDLIRDVFAELPLSRAKGFAKGRFSFNSSSGRCSACSGRGFQLVDMQFLSDVWIRCEACEGKRFNEETLRVELKGMNVAQVLELEIHEALEFFGRLPRIRRILQTLVDVGLGYLQLGQPAPTLSGGEAQRVKLASELSRPQQGSSLYILDEPTTGLHFADVKKLMEVLQRLVEAGNTVVVVEHNLDVIKVCDWVLDLGPEGGDRGGEIVSEGTPEVVAADPRSFTGQCLARLLDRGRREEAVG